MAIVPWFVVDELPNLGTALQAAAYYGHHSVVNTLLASGADPDSENGYLLRPLFAAFCMGHFSTAKVLREAGADPYPPNRLFRNICDSKELRNLVKNFENYTELEPYSPHLLHEAALQFIKMGQISIAEEMYRRAPKVGERILETDHLSTLASLSNLANVLQDQGKYEAAEEMREKRRAIVENKEKRRAAEEKKEREGGAGKSFRILIARNQSINHEGQNREPRAFPL